MADDFDRIRRFVDNPATRAVLGLASIAGLFIYAGKRFSSPEGRRSYVEEVRQAAAERKDRDRWHERKNQRIRTKLDYFNGRGGELYCQRTLIVIGPEPPFGDEVFEELKAGFRHRRFCISSRLAGARLELSWDVADCTGGLGLKLSDGRSWSLGIYEGHGGLSQYQSGNELPDVDMARLACRLLATPKSPFTTITLIRPEAREIREQIWRDHVSEHPELAEEDWPW